jgi:hypothetical protein
MVSEALFTADGANTNAEGLMLWAPPGVAEVSDTALPARASSAVAASLIVVGPTTMT